MMNSAGTSIDEKEINADLYMLIDKQHQTGSLGIPHQNTSTINQQTQLLPQKSF